MTLDDALYYLMLLALLFMCMFLVKHAGGGKGK